MCRPPSATGVPPEQLQPPPTGKEAKKEGGKGKADKDVPDGMHEYLVILAGRHLLGMPLEALQVRPDHFRHCDVTLQVTVSCRRLVRSR